MQEEKQSLQNFANKFGMVVKEQVQGDKRRKNAYYLVLDGWILSPALDYIRLNHFLLGWDRCVTFNKEKRL